VHTANLKVFSSLHAHSIPSHPTPRREPLVPGATQGVLEELVEEKSNCGQANRLISTGQLSTLLYLHTRPINLVVYKVSHARSSFEGGFALICLQRLSFPDIATLRCH
jgi:hypothetical protein